MCEMGDQLEKAYSGIVFDVMRSMGRPGLHSAPNDPALAPSQANPRPDLFCQWQGILRPVYR